MIKNLYSIRDLKVGFENPMVDVNDSTAIRNFTSAVRHETTIFHEHPEDFQLFCVGSFDTNTGAFESLESPRFLVNALDLLRFEDLADRFGEDKAKSIVESVYRGDFDV